MLNNASDYKFVNATAASNIIHGNILPVVNPTGGYAILYFENYLFFLEAFYERNNIESAGNNEVQMPNNMVLNSGNIRRLDLTQDFFGSQKAILAPYIGYIGQKAVWINPNSTWAVSYVVNSYSDRIRISDYIQNAELLLPEQKSPYTSLKPYGNGTGTKLLKSEFIRAKFWTFNNMSRLYIDLIYFGDFATSVTSQYINSSGNITETAVPLNSSSLNGVRQYTTHNDTVYQSRRIVATYKSKFFTCPYAKHAYLFFEGGALEMNGSQRNTAYVWTTIPLTISNGDINVPSSLIDDIADKIVATTGKPATSTINIYTMKMVIDFEFPARLNGVNWNWQPSYT